MGLDMDFLHGWIGKTESVHDVATVVPLRALSATLDCDTASIDLGYDVPPCWHWLYFLPLHRQSEIGPDGHGKRGGFLPPVPLPRRMWAGSRIEFLTSIRAGQAINRSSRISDVRSKDGRTGPLVFVNLHHEIRAEGQVSIREEQDIVYRDMAQTGKTAPSGVPAPAHATWTREIYPDDVLLFRYSALTFNGHRIHYDRRYVTEVEGYPGLIVHGPLIATLLLDLLRRQLPTAQVRRFAFKAMKPIFDTAPFSVCGRIEGDKIIKLWAVTAEGHLAMDARVELA